MIVSRMGRPKGWKPGMSYAEMRAGNTSGSATPSSYVPRSRALPKHSSAGVLVRRIRPRAPGLDGPGNTAGGYRRRGRPPKMPSPGPHEVYRRTEAPFVAFLCEWAECSAELHNLETLRRHVRAVHSSDAGGLCRWGGCERRARASEVLGEGSEDVIYADGAQLERHVEEAHLVPFSWHVGDGPRNVGVGRTETKKVRKESDEVVKKEEEEEEEEEGEMGRGGDTHGTANAGGPETSNANHDADDGADDDTGGKWSREGSLNRDRDTNGDATTNGHQTRGQSQIQSQSQSQGRIVMDDEVPDFLKDASGKQVTPWVRFQELEDWATWKKNRRKLKELLIRMDENLPSEESDNNAVDDTDV